KQYRMLQDREKLRQVKERQNKKMYKMALKLKEKEQTFQEKIREKQAALAQLTGGNTGTRDVQSYIDRRGVDPAPQAYADAFRNLSGAVREILDAAGGEDSVIEEPTMEKIVQDAGENPVEKRKQTDALDDVYFEAMSYVFEAVLSREDHAVEKNGSPGETEDDFEDGDDISFDDMEFDSEDPLDDYVELTVKENRLKAYLSIKEHDPEKITKESLLEYLRKKGVTYGIVDDKALQAWLEKKDTDKRFAVAKGKLPRMPEDGSVEYFFETEYMQAGQLLADGTMDFRERGDVPYVESGTLLAQKKRGVAGAAGINVAGEAIQVDEAHDPIFSAGENTRYSEDELQIFADTDGQPHLDAMGNVSVCDELTISGDVDFETGNINFNGNIVVKGTIKEGFKVKGTNLTADTIEGAEIELTGDLTVKSGMIDADISAQGSVTVVKYVNNCRISSFGSLVVVKELIDSKVRLSGSCNIERGVVISSDIVAKTGIKAGRVGTESTDPSRLRVGVNDHINSLISRVDGKIQEKSETIEGLEKEIKSLEAEDQEIYDTISQHAHVQDRSQVEMRELEKALEDARRSNNSGKVKKIENTIRDYEKKAEKAENQINELFERQDLIAEKISDRKKRIAKLRADIAELEKEKEGLIEYSRKESPVPRVVVNKRAASGTRIEGPNSSIALKDDASRCKIEELGKMEDGVLKFYEMEISNLAN
ncbi:MAG: FapA family protein, partial [Desulfarculaceae bacterium]|nr:FapA family protein [Desulfarculaceae bacterium]